MTTNPQDPQIVHPVSSTNLDLVRAEIGHMMGLVDQLRSEIESERLAHQIAADELIARAEARAANIRADADAYAVETRQLANEYSAEQRSEIEQLRNSQIAANELLAKAEVEAQTRRDEILSDARARLASLIDSQLDAPKASQQL